MLSGELLCNVMLHLYKFYLMPPLIIISVFVMNILAVTSSAQSEKIHVREERAIRLMLDHRKALNFEKGRTIKAWSVQLMITRDKYEVSKRKNEVERHFKNVKVDWVFEAPYYRLSAGVFYTKLEAEKLLNNLITRYPKACLFKNSRANPSDL